jgi:hypothetical protein
MVALFSARVVEETLKRRMHKTYDNRHRKVLKAIVKLAVSAKKHASLVVLVKISLHSNQPPA